MKKFSILRNGADGNMIGLWNKAERRYNGMTHTQFSDPDKKRHIWLFAKLTERQTGVLAQIVKLTTSSLVM